MIMSDRDTSTFLNYIQLIIKEENLNIATGYLLINNTDQYEEIPTVCNEAQIC